MTDIEPNSESQILFSTLLAEVQGLKVSENLVDTDEVSLKNLLQERLRDQSSILRSRILEEFFGVGPLKSALSDPEISEILINSPKDIWIERDGRLSKLEDTFFSSHSYMSFVKKLCREMDKEFTYSQPLCQGLWQGHRVQVVAPPIVKNYVTVCIRKFLLDTWSLESLFHSGWCNSEQVRVLTELITSQKSLLVLGGTGSGKTTVLNSFLKLLPPNERLLILEDTDELIEPNSASAKLQTRSDPQGILPEITLSDLSRYALRMRPDRIVVGEVRGAEAKDLLLAFSCGHQGSMATLHAKNIQEGLARLEMLIQLGAPQWSIATIRNLIFQSIPFWIFLEKQNGKRLLESIYQLTSVEDFGILSEQIA